MTNLMSLSCRRITPSKSNFCTIRKHLFKLPNVIKPTAGLVNQALAAGKSAVKSIKDRALDQRGADRVSPTMLKDGIARLEQSEETGRSISNTG